MQFRSLEYRHLQVMGATRVSHVSDLQRGLTGTELKMLILRDLKKHHSFFPLQSDHIKESKVHIFLAACKVIALLIYDNTTERW